MNWPELIDKWLSCGLTLFVVYLLGLFCFGKRME